MSPDGTMALCATCHRAIYCWSDRALLFGHDEELDVFCYSLNATTVHYWTHWVPARHEAKPMIPLIDHTPPARVLLCASCHRPQEHDEQGWHCDNPACLTKHDKD